jgi:hypothetical protein
MKCKTIKELSIVKHNYILKNLLSMLKEFNYYYSVTSTSKYVSNTKWYVTEVIYGG